MNEAVAIKAQPRAAAGKGAARALRRQGLAPAVIYGGGGSAESIAIDAAHLTRYAAQPAFMNAMCQINLDGKTIRVIPRDLQRDPIKGAILHIDFMRLSKGQTLEVEIPVRFINEEESPGLKRGGVLNVIRHAVLMRCPAEAIPDSIGADLKGLEIGDSIHISHISLPDAVVPVIADRDFTIAAVVAPASVRGKEEEEEEPAAEEDAKAQEASKDDGEGD